jgi:hypothetical protein
MRLFQQSLEVRNLTADDVETGAPEVYVLDVDIEAFGESDGIGEAGGGEEIVVVGAEANEMLCAEAQHLGCPQGFMIWGAPLALPLNSSPPTRGKPRCARWGFLVMFYKGL